MMAAGGLSTIRRGRAALIGAAVLALAGCSTVQDLAGVPRPGLQNDGTYVLTSEEQALGCRELEERSLGLKQHMQTLPAQAMDQMQQLPNTVSAALGRLFGSPGACVPAVAEYNEARAESVALNESLAKKGCASLETASIKH